MRNQRIMTKVRDLEILQLWVKEFHRNLQDPGYKIYEDALVTFDPNGNSSFPVSWKLASNKQDGRFEFGP